MYRLRLSTRVTNALIGVCNLCDPQNLTVSFLRAIYPRRTHIHGMTLISLDYDAPGDREWKRALMLYSWNFISTTPVQRVNRLSDVLYYPTSELCVMRTRAIRDYLCFVV